MYNDFAFKVHEYYGKKLLFKHEMGFEDEFRITEIML